MIHAYTRSSVNNIRLLTLVDCCEVTCPCLSHVEHAFLFAELCHGPDLGNGNSGQRVQDIYMKLGHQGGGSSSG